MDTDLLNQFGWIVDSFDFMDAEERREAIEDAGLDPNNYSFDE